MKIDVKALLAIVVATLAIATSCAKSDPESTASTSEPGVAHAHALAVDPTNEDLLIATHTGVYRLRGENQPVRIRPSYQDTMGLTIASPNLYFSSGHPDVAGLQAGQPGLLGLMQSTDRGISWTSLSLSGTADLHSLAFSDGQLFAWDSVSSQFMVTSDFKSWDARSTLELLGFSVNPASPQNIVAAVGRGVSRSLDGGRSWSVPDGPGLTAISWAANGELWGVDHDGTAYLSADYGSTWTASGKVPGAPQAMFATDNAVWIAAERLDGATAIYRSQDNGISWQQRFEDRS